MVVVDGEVRTAVHSSKGNQLKWEFGGKWYKADFLGYEGAAEYFVSEILRHSNVKQFVPYQLEQIQYRGQSFHGCVSDDFLKDGQTIITSQRLFLSCYGSDVDRRIGGQAAEDRIQSFVESVEEATGLHGFGAYLTVLMELDALVLNEDRHYHNIAVIQNSDGTFELCPVFDNGAALLSDMKNDYPLEKRVNELIPKVYAKPFLTRFDRQVDICQRLYGKQLQIADFDLSFCMAGIKNMYGAAISERLQEIYEYQSLRYPDLKSANCGDEFSE